MTGRTCERATGNAVQLAIRDIPAGGDLVEEVLRTAVTLQLRHVVSVSRDDTSWHVQGIDAIALRDGLTRLNEEAWRGANAVADQAPSLEDGTVAPSDSLCADFDRYQRLIECTEAITALMDVDRINGLAAITTREETWR